ncbi:hypothetical protein ACA910_010017 [Epithemia clementina (nom. ined.)]
MQSFWKRRRLRRLGAVDYVVQKCQLMWRKVVVLASSWWSSWILGGRRQQQRKKEKEQFPVQPPQQQRRPQRRWFLPSWIPRPRRRVVFLCLVFVLLFGRGFLVIPGNSSTLDGGFLPFSSPPPGLPPPVEISYSRFLQLLQAQSSSSSAPAQQQQQQSQPQPPSMLSLFHPTSKIVSSSSSSSKPQPPPSSSSASSWIGEGPELQIRIPRPAQRRSTTTRTTATTIPMGTLTGPGVPELVQRLQGVANSNSNANPPPVVVGHVKIGDDRLHYLLYQAAPPTALSAPQSPHSRHWSSRTIIPTIPWISTSQKTPTMTKTTTTTTTPQPLRPHFALAVPSQDAATSTSSSTTTTWMTSSPSSTSDPVIWVTRAYTRKVNASPQLLDSLTHHQVPFSALMPPAPPKRLPVGTLVLGVYVAFLYRFYKVLTQQFSSKGGGDSGDGPGKLATFSITTSFEEIQGMDGPKLEVMELVDTLKYPQKYALLGARAPTGLLLEGPPGTGKTMLAKATAASAGVPLLYCSGSDFVEVYVGRGAARVRNLFERAAKLAPCIIFIDELDALGKSRDFGGGGSSPFFGNGGGRSSNDEAEQTLNQLLACMDGLDSTRRICVLAATNRKDVLDPALVRPGRLDRIVTLTLPDAAGREQILRVHCRKLPGFAEYQTPSSSSSSSSSSTGGRGLVDLRVVAALTDGFSGAELESLVNEAAIRAVRRVSAEMALRQQQQQQQQQSSSEHADLVSWLETTPPQVLAVDFDASLDNFYATRRRGQRRWGISTAGKSSSKNNNNNNNGSGSGGGGLFPPLWAS